LSYHSISKNVGTLKIISEQFSSYKPVCLLFKVMLYIMAMVVSAENVLEKLEKFSEFAILRINFNREIYSVLYDTTGIFKAKGRKTKTKGELLSDFLFEDDIEKMQSAVKKLKSSNTREETISVRILHNSGDYRWFEIHITKESVRGGKKVLLCSMMDVHELKSCVEKYKLERDSFKDLAFEDQLTGLLNRNGYEFMVKRMFSRGPAKKRIGIIFMDIDKLKDINDKMGHKAGDKLIRETADVLLRKTRAKDIIVRYGGDEMLVITEEEAGEKFSPLGLSKRILKELGEGKSLSTVSIGLNVTTMKKILKSKTSGQGSLMTAWQKAVDKADENVYKAKKAGRNAIVYRGRVYRSNK